MWSFGVSHLRSAQFALHWFHSYKSCKLKFRAVLPFSVSSGRCCGPSTMLRGRGLLGSEVTADGLGRVLNAGGAAGGWNRDVWWCVTVQDERRALQLDESLYLWSSVCYGILHVCDGLQDVERYESHFVKLITAPPPAFGWFDHLNDTWGYFCGLFLWNAKPRGRTSSVSPCRTESSLLFRATKS